MKNIFRQGSLWFRDTVFAVAITALLSAQMSAPQLDADPPVIIVGNEEIRASQIRGILESTNQEAIAEDRTQLTNFLNQYLDQILVASESIEKEYLTPARRLTITLYAISLAARAYVEESATVSEEEIRAYYETNPAAFTRVEQRHAAHIVVPDAEKAQEVIRALAEGMSWEEAVKTYSTDASTKDNNGILGWVRRGAINPALSDEIFRLKEGETSPVPIQSEFGFHIVKVMEIRPETRIPFDEVKKRIANQILNEKRRKYFNETLPQVVEKLRKQRGARLDSAAIPAITTVEPSYEVPPLLADLEKRIRGTRTREKTRARTPRIPDAVSPSPALP
ncbi:MAG: peptidylprolyl isomerase [bacterium JZ-2024 1]